MKVRIGNDISLHVTLLGDSNTDYVNIKSIRAYLINVTRQLQIDEQHRNDSIDYRNQIEDRTGVIHYISRFPMEPASNAYRGTAYDLMHCGHPTFHARPLAVVFPYTGFGIRPHSFDAFKNHVWGYDDMEDLHSKMLFREGEYKRQYEQCEFMAPVSSSSSSNRIYVNFPAENLLYTGVYKLVIIAKLYEPGYGANNLRTVTMDYKDVFELVSSSDESGVSGNIRLDIGNMKQASGIEVVGNTTVGILDTSDLRATVFPVDIDNDNVEWSFRDQDKDYVQIVGGSTEKVCKIIGLKLPEGQPYYPAVLTVRSQKTPDVKKEVTIMVVSGTSKDVYVYEGEYKNDGKQASINLHLTDGGTVSVDTSSNDTWYEHKS